MNGVKIATALLGTLPLLAQQSTDCPPPTRTQRLAGLLNRARNTNAPANPNCNATTASNSSPATPTAGAGNGPQGNVIGTGRLSAQFLARTGRIENVQISGGGTIIWQYQRSNQTVPTISWRRSDGLDVGMAFYGRKANNFYLGNPTGRGNGEYAVGTVEGNALTLRSVGSLPQGLTNLDGSPREVDPPKVTYSYSFMPYPEQINDALRQQHSLAANQKGGKLVMTPEGGEPVHITVVHTQFDDLNFWVNSDDASKAFIIVGTDNATVTPLFRQQDGSWLTEDGKPMPLSGVLH